MNYANILGVNIACVKATELLHTVTGWTAQDVRRTILYVNAHCLNTAYSDTEYRDILNAADLVYPDGISVVWSGRLLRSCQMQKVTGADWIYDFCEYADRHSISIYILAGKPGVAKQAAAKLLEKWPGLKITGAQDGYFQEMSEGDILRDIQMQSPQVLFVGQGTPRQEKWISGHRSEIGAPVCWAVGALFDFVAGIEARVPGWMNSLALEWLWRLLIDPKGKWKRYIIGNPLYVARVLRQRLTS